MTIVAQRWRIVIVCLLGAAMIYFPTHGAYRDYYAFVTVEQACIENARLGCPMRYYISLFFVPIGSVMAVLVALLPILSLAGRRPRYVVTTERLLIQPHLFSQRIDSIELRGASVQRTWVGIQVSQGSWRIFPFHLGYAAADRLFECVSELIEKQRP